MSTYNSNKNWRKNNPDQWYNQKNRYYRKHQKLNASKKIYTDDEIKLIMTHDICDVELSKILNRSVMAIQVKRSKINKGL